jgi:hypothetical protein
VSLQKNLLKSRVQEGMVFFVMTLHRLFVFSHAKNKC